MSLVIVVTSFIAHVDVEEKQEPDNVLVDSDHRHVRN